MNMTDRDITLAQKLQSIAYSGDYFNMVFSWLTYRGVKPVSVIDLSSDISAIEALTGWYSESGLSFPKDPSDEDLVFISKNKDKAEIMSKIFKVKLPILEIIKCEYFGYPDESAYAYLSQMYTLPESKKNIRAAKTSDIEKHFSEYWKPYIAYIMRQDNITEDSQVAKNWFDICAAEIPTIHQKFLAQYEENKTKNIERQNNLLKTLDTFNNISVDEKEKLKQVMLRNISSGWITVSSEDKESILEWLNKSRIQKEIDSSNEKQIYFTTDKDKIDAFRELNTFDSIEASDLRKKYFD